MICAMITIDLLKNHPQHIEQLAYIWYEFFGKIRLPGCSLEKVVKRFADYLNEDILPLAYIALDGTKAIGICALREQDAMRPDLTPWLGALVVAPEYRGQGIGKLLINATKNKAKELNFSTLYLFAFEPKYSYYLSLGWKELTKEEFEGRPITVFAIDL